jgi:hypothetical protein
MKSPHHIIVVLEEIKNKRMKISCVLYASMTISCQDSLPEAGLDGWRRSSESMRLKNNV